MRFSSFQNLGSFRRRTFDSSNMFLMQEFPALTVISGANFVPQFVTPLALNTIDPARIVFGGANGVYESMDRGDTISQISTTVVASRSAGGGAIAAGGPGNADLLYVAGCQGSCSDNMDGADGIYRRTSSGGSLEFSLGDNSTFDFVGVTIDPDDALQAMAVSLGNVYRPLDGGAIWTTSTGDLPTLAPGTLRSMEFVNSAKGDAVLVGADRGIFLSLEATGFSDWAEFGAGLPNSPVYEMVYDQPTDTLIVGTLGSGSYKVMSVSTGGGDPIFADGFESGDTSAWSRSTP